MTRILQAITALVLLCAAPIPARPGEEAAGKPGSPYVDHLDVSLVLVPTVVRDAAGRPVTDLEKSDFRIFDDEEPREIAAFGKESRPVSVLLALDTSPSMEGHVHAVRQAALEFVRGQRPGTSFALVTFNEGVFLDLDFTSDPEAMEGAIGAAAPGGDATALLDALKAAAYHLETREGARVAVVFTDGTDTVYPMNEAEARLADGLEVALKRDVSFYTVSFGPRAARGLLKRIADETGGEAFVASNRSELARAFAHVAESVGNRYLLAFRPPQAGEPGFRSIRVEISREGLRLAARRRYLAQ